MVVSYFHSRHATDPNTCAWRWLEWSSCSSICNLDGTKPDDAPTMKKRGKTPREVKVPQELCEGEAEEECPPTPCTGRTHKFFRFKTIINSCMCQRRFCLEIGPCSLVGRAHTATTLVEVTGSTWSSERVLPPRSTCPGDYPVRQSILNSLREQVKLPVSHLYPAKVKRKT